MTLSPDNIIDICAAVIALAALALAVWQGVAMQRHNRLSVMPRLTLHHHLAGSRGELGIAVSNDGLGPAIVTDCTLEVDGKVMPVENDNGWETAITSLNLEAFKFRYTTIAPHGVIPTGGTVWLLSTPATDTMRSRADEIQVAFQRLNVRLCYQSMYGDGREVTYQQTQDART